MMEKIIDVGIITIIPSEIEALLQIFGIEKKSIIHTNGPYDYIKTKIFSEQAQRELSVVITYFNKESGNIESSICTTCFLRDWYPKLMCLVGIAAGIRGKVKIGDVIIPSKVHDRTIKVYKEKQLLPRSVSYSRTDLVDGMLKLNMLSNEKFLNECNKNLGKELKLAMQNAKKLELLEKDLNKKLLIHDGSILSDNILIRDGTFFDSIISETDEKCRGGDMEAAGFVRACRVENNNFPWLIVRGVSDFGDHAKSDSFQLLAAKSACTALKAYLDKCINVDLLPDNYRGHELKNSFEFNIFQQIQDSYDHCRWSEVCRIGNIVSRYLWLSGQYDLRVRIGKMVEDAASHGNDNETRVATLIDDIGWTSYVLGQDHIGIKNINDGIRIAREIDNNYYIAKGNRHLASICRQKKDMGEAAKFLSEAKEYAKDILDENRKTEMANGLLFSEAQYLFCCEDYKNSIVKFREVIKNFEDYKDTEREVKVYVLLGRALVAEKNEEDAISTFYKGLEKSCEISRYDQIASNTEELLKLILDLNEREKLIKYVNNYCISKKLYHESNRWLEHLNN